MNILEHQTADRIALLERGHQMQREQIQQLTEQLAEKDAAIAQLVITRDQLRVALLDATGVSA